MGEIIIFVMFNVLTKEGLMIGSNQSPIIAGFLGVSFSNPEKLKS